MHRAAQDQHHRENDQRRLGQRDGKREARGEDQDQRSDHARVAGTLRREGAAQRREDRGQ
jgi:hypothetical protein